ncbi:helix-turn-helix domain-containing protein, partial [Mesorhizobium sp. LNHC229A00]|uniref:helix-turn-helix domain-containing protein n=1 Tax=Mesorhizobium sp. LNHC229A00 TaxID=1287240 RepID=UPI000683F728
VEFSGIGRTRIFAAINAGQLVARKFGRRTVILRQDLEAFLGALPARAPKELPANTIRASAFLTNKEFLGQEAIDEQILDSSAATDKAAQWLASTPREQRPRPVMVELRERLGLSAVDACAAIREANLIRARSP